MSKEALELVESLSNKDVRIRLDSLKKLIIKIENGELPRPLKGEDVNNHIHTTYSFSPYSPTKAIWMAYNAGLCTAGIMDHDSICGVREFIEAGKIVGIATTIGVEVRVDFSKTELKGKRINNPDQSSIAYVTLHGIPHTQIDTVAEFFKPYIEHRNIRNRQMVEKINAIFEPYGIKLDFENDVVPVSNSIEGGSITERHILFSLSEKLIHTYGKGKALLSFLKDKLGLPIGQKTEVFLSDGSNENYAYDLLGVLKGELVNSFYINATKECPDVKEIIKFSDSVGAVVAYAYLGDVGDSVTGDKKTQKFEDDYLEQLFDILKETGFKAVTYMPSRNTTQQLIRLRGLCDKYSFFQISGEDINSPRQSFICQAMRNKEFKNLFDATWALIGHEKASTVELSNGMFSKETALKYPNLEERIRKYKDIGIKNKY